MAKLTELDEMFTYLACNEQTNYNIYIYLHIHRHTQISADTINKYLTGIYNNMSKDSHINKEDCVLIYSCRDNIIQPIIISNKSINRTINWDKDDLKKILLHLLTINRDGEDSMYVYRLIFSTCNTLSRYELYCYNDSVAVSDITDMYPKYAEEIVGFNVNDVIEYKSNV